MPEEFTCVKNNKVHLCASCDHKYPECPSGKADVLYGDGVGNDNICCCSRYEPSQYIEIIPSAQPEPQWILCDERMPEEHEWIGTKKFGTTRSDEVYVTFENSKGERFTKHLHFYNGELSSYDKTNMDVWYKDYKPIAWMPLPEPYAPDGERGVLK